jgi:hypothetical protein
MAKILLSGVTALISVLLFSGCSANIFSYLNPTVIDVQNDPNILVGMGDNYLNQLDYTNAYKAYSRAVSLDPRKSRALEGSSIAYIYMHFAFTDLYTAIMSSNYASLGPNNIYNVGAVVSRTLGKILRGEADGVIPANDVNDSLNYFIFNSFYTIFNTIDANNNDNIDFDTNDYIMMYPDLTTTNRVQDVIDNSISNADLVPVIGMAYNFNYVKRVSFTNSQYWSYRSINVVNNALLSTNTKAVVTMISNTFVHYITNLNTFFDYFTTNSLSGRLGLGSDALLTNFFTNNFDVFTNELYSQGIWPASEITNAMPDMTNIYPVLTNYYGVTNFD